MQSLQLLRQTLIAGGVILLCLINNGCTSLKLSEKTARYQVISKTVRQTKLSTITHYNVRGAFSIAPQNSTAGANGKPVLANYDWQQNGENHYKIRIFSTLNIYSAFIDGRPGLVTLRQSDKKIYRALTPEGVMWRVLGWSLPIRNLYYWVRGLPASGAAQGANYDVYGHLIRLQQDGWTVQFSAYAPVNGIDLPRLLRLTRPGIEVKIAMKQWQFTSVSSNSTATQ